MTATPSTMLPLGTLLPAFDLPDFDGQPVSSADFHASPALLVAFLCPHCPFVRHIRHGFASFAAEYTARGLAVVAINSNDVSAFPEDGPDGMRHEAGASGYAFPYLFDETQQAAKDFQAACTPDLFLFDAARRLAYRGQFDDSRPRTAVPVTGRDIRAAVDAVMAGRPVEGPQRSSVGCNIKWRAGNAPDYFGRRA
jgi:thiol-disulfide isomerase/thioredoxin